jgi:hypothetical protein
MLLLATVVDFEAWDATDLRRSFWDFCRSMYDTYEQGMINIITPIITAGDPLWICPAMQAAHVNIKEVYLFTIDGNGLKFKLEFNKTTGWNKTLMQ